MGRWIAVCELRDGGLGALFLQVHVTGLCGRPELENQEVFRGASESGTAWRIPA